MAIRVLIVDDSVTSRAVIRDILERQSDIEVIATAQDAYSARDKVVQLKPDVICLDVEMPKMDGIAFLQNLMQYMPTPVVMVSSLTRSGTQVTLDALEAGAVDFVTKPHAYIYDGGADIEKELVEKVRTAAKARVFRKAEPSAGAMAFSRLAETTQKLIAIGASTGGTEALKEVLIRMPLQTPGIVVVQHMPANFTGPFAQRLNTLCKIDVKEAKDSDSVVTGQALIAPGDRHMVVRRSGARYYVELGGGEKVSGHRPSVDVLFNSVAQSVGANAIGIILTGMGGDGARGMLKMHQKGAKTIAQDEKTCVVFGMPKVAIEFGGVDRVAPLEMIPQAAMQFVGEISRH
ncbi:MAG: chemotaxis response regulator protein-glutamate methylesterase [Helicobacteraceae bacterium]|jgi:two-component system chemotaxis response regulator CheB|nr:chemotaxis response regulator protein-glutamate methylesterase [Helicobacteraceae bacterium]